jgi:hypothetical protein
MDAGDGAFLAIFPNHYNIHKYAFNPLKKKGDAHVLFQPIPQNRKTPSRHPFLSVEISVISVICVLYFKSRFWPSISLYL